MATTPSINKAARGITRTLSGFVVHEENINETPVFEEVPDQFGAIAERQVYDHKYTLSLTVISASASTAAPAHANDLLSYAGHAWYVDSCAEAGTYQGVRRWTIQATRYDNCP